MSYIKSLIIFGIDTFIPFGDKIPGLHDSTPKISKREQRVRLNVSRAMKRAIKKDENKNGFLAQGANNIKASAAKYSQHTKNDYICSQIGKTAHFVDYIIPGSGVVASSVSHINKAQNLSEYVTKDLSTKQQIFKVAKTAAPLIAWTTSSLWQPLLPTVTKELVAVGAVAVLGTTLALDAISCIKNRHSS
jgi:hypothetical protein